MELKKSRIIRFSKKLIGKTFKRKEKCQMQLWKRIITNFKNLRNGEILSTHIKILIHKLELMAGLMLYKNQFEP